MGFISGAAAQIAGQRALRLHISANQMANEGKVEAATEKYAQARTLYEQAMRERLAPPNVRLGYSVLLLRSGEFEKARDVMQDMRTIKQMTEENWFELRLNYSTYLWKTGKLDEALETIRRAAKFKMNSAIYTTMGMYLVDKARLTGDFAEVQAFNAQAMDYDDEDGGTLDNVAAMYEAMSEQARNGGDAEQASAYRAQARTYYEKAHERKPRQITTIYALAKLLYEDGEVDRARSLLSGTDDLYYSALCPVTREMMEALKRTVG